MENVSSFWGGKGRVKFKEVPELPPTKTPFLLNQAHEEFFEELAVTTGNPVSKLIGDAIGFYMAAMNAMQSGKTVSIIDVEGNTEANFVLAMKFTGALNLKSVEKEEQVV